MDRKAVHDELERARSNFHELHDLATDTDLRRRSNGTRWTNQQLLFHMLLGYLIMRALMNLVRLFGRLPASVSRTYAAMLNAATTPFDVVNYLGSWAGGSALGRHGQMALCDRVVAALHRRLDSETDADLARGMHYPTVGPVLQGLHDPRRPLSISYAAFRFSPSPARAPRGGGLSREALKVLVTPQTVRTPSHWRRPRRRRAGRRRAGAAEYIGQGGAAPRVRRRRRTWPERSAGR